MSKLSAEAQAQLAELATTLAHNPKTRKQFVKLIKEIDPSKSFPDVDMEDLKDSMASQFAERDQKDEAKRVKDRLEAQRQGLIASGRFKEEDVVKIEKEVMEKYGLSDYEAAAKLYAADLQPATPTSEIKSRTWKLPTITKEDMGNLNQHTLDNAYRAVDDLKRNRVH